MNIIRIIPCIVLSTLLSLNSSAAPQPKELSVMAYNVENLFDTVHDAGKEDWTYLPKSVKDASADAQRYCRGVIIPVYRDDCFNLDWNERLLSKKIANIGKVIRSSFKGAGPDVVVLEEVENINVLTMLRDRALADMGYETIVLIDGPDQRGIDVAMLSRYPLSEPAKLHEVDLSNLADEKEPGKNLAPRKLTRGILEATFLVGKRRITVLGNHWPSQMSKTPARTRAAEVFYAAVTKIKGQEIIAAGDFNVLPKEAPNPITTYITNNRRKYSFDDAEIKRRELAAREDLLPGTHYYQKKWSSLDRIFVLRKPDSKTLTPQWDTFAIGSFDFLFTVKDGVKVPHRFNTSTGEGYADHLPIMMEFTLN